ncbi:hypothetical protein HOO65_050757 [Ceratocystis lukuohia]|uniref:Rhodopsin domain-containing protein n=1 Tax=Ceratocystis lukuohia TaxID=2019550 RepID=A0ABR4MHA0_9PEZI
MSSFPVINGTEVAIEPPPGYICDFDHPKQKNAVAAYCIVAVFGFLSTLFCGQRLYVNAVVRKRLWWDDFYGSVGDARLCFVMDHSDLYPRKGWDFRITSGSCIDRPAMYQATAGIGMATDVLIFAIPIPMAMRLQMSRRHRIGLVFLFFVGSITVITSIVRLVLLVTSLYEDDLPWSAGLITIWVLIESNLMVMCACLPTLRLFIRTMWPRILPDEAEAIQNQQQQLHERDNEFGDSRRKSPRGAGARTLLSRRGHGHSLESGLSDTLSGLSTLDLGPGCGPRAPDEGNTSVNHVDQREAGPFGEGQKRDESLVGEEEMRQILVMGETMRDEIQRKETSSSSSSSRRGTSAKRGRTGERGEDQEQGQDQREARGGGESGDGGGDRRGSVMYAAWEWRLSEMEGYWGKW